jgi:segregation and condensation protein A
MSPETAYKVKLQEFEGPLELLLELIEKRKLFINEISLAQVADDFITYIKQFEQFPIAESAHFILIASTLLLIKSKSLLPNLPLTEEEETSIKDLELRLKIYKRMKELSVHIKERFGKEILFAASHSRPVEPVFSPDESMTTPSLYEAIKSVLHNLPKKEFIPKAVVKKVISLEETINRLTERVKTSLKMSFREFSRHGKEEKVHVIVSFLAMLELVKQGVIMVHQEQEYGDIQIETQDVSVPRYS